MCVYVLDGLFWVAVQVVEIKQSMLSAGLGIIFFYQKGVFVTC